MLLWCVCEQVPIVCAQLPVTRGQQEKIAKCFFIVVATAKGLSTADKSNGLTAGWGRAPPDTGAGASAGHSRTPKQQVTDGLALVLEEALHGTALAGTINEVGALRLKACKHGDISTEHSGVGGPR